MSLDLLTHRARPPAGEAAGALVVLHGRGADEHDLEPLAHALDPERRLAVFLPRGPLSLPPGGAHWYILREVGAPDPPTFTATFDRLSRWVDAAVESAGVTSDRLVIAGFSQGAVMAYSLGLAATRPRPAAILAFSGFIPTVPGLELDLASRSGMPVSITHGTLDTMIAVEFGRAARERLAVAGLDVRYGEESAGHGITPRAFEQAKAVLERALG
ncbi:MAG: dienelactone hydrolase family protein [Actinomycetota bacterium]|nr:dienelactone hydrolase family protein [Actinomycetota bacterium]